MPLAFRASFAHFLRTRHFARQFRRFVLADVSAAHPGAHSLPPDLSAGMLAASDAGAAELLTQLGSQPGGLTQAQADAVRERTGPNEIQQEKPLPWWHHLWHCYSNPFNLLLTVLAGVSWSTDDMRGAIVIGTMVVFSTLLRFWQEARSNRAADALKALVSNTATVMRPGACAPTALLRCCSRATASRFSRPPCTLGTHCPSARL